MERQPQRAASGAREDRGRKKNLLEASGDRGFYASSLEGEEKKKKRRFFNPRSCSLLSSPFRLRRAWEEGEGKEGLVIIGSASGGDRSLESVDHRGKEERNWSVTSSDLLRRGRKNRSERQQSKAIRKRKGGKGETFTLTIVARS